MGRRFPVGMGMSAAAGRRGTAHHGPGGAGAAGSSGRGRESGCAVTGSARTSRHRPAALTLSYGYDDDVPFAHDPLNPHPEYPTPIEDVLRLTKSERETRVRALVELSRAKYAEAI